MIRVVKPDEKRRWISLFREASQLSIDDLYEYDESQVLKGLAPSLMAESNSGLFPLNFQEIFMEMR